MDFEPTNNSFENEYPKLVRDNIPQIIKAKKGVDSETSILQSDAEFLKQLLRKMVEEAKELEFSEQHGNMQEELADVLKIIDAVLKLKGWAMEGIVAVKKEKREKNGGFEKRTLMLKRAE